MVDKHPKITSGPCSDFKESKVKHQKKCFALHTLIPESIEMKIGKQVLSNNHYRDVQQKNLDQDSVRCYVQGYKFKIRHNNDVLGLPCPVFQLLQTKIGEMILKHNPSR